MGRTDVFTATLPGELALESRGRGIDDEISILDLSATDLKVQGKLAIEPGQIVEVIVSRRRQPCRVALVRLLWPKGEVEAGLEFLIPLPRTAWRVSKSEREYEHEKSNNLYVHRFGLGGGACIRTENRNPSA